MAVATGSAGQVKERPARHANKEATMTIIRQQQERLHARPLEWRKAGTGRLGHGMVFLTVKLTNGDDPGRLVRVELTEHQARELAADLIEAADASNQMYPSLW